jgi:hypothetical protein
MSDPPYHVTREASRFIPSILPIQGGLLGVYSSHAFTDHVTGFRGPMKRSIGSHVMADQLKTMFEAARKKAAP